MDLYKAGLTIGELSTQTGVGISTLRAWERRHGFPVPRRLPSGHRRYLPQDAAAVLAIVDDRAHGSTLEAALSRARGLSLAPRNSILATVRSELAGAAPVTLSTTAMLVLSRAIEDEAAVRADAPVFIGAFQRGAHWRRTRPTWRRVAARSREVIAIAAGIQDRADGNLREVGIPSTHPVAQEWAVICDSASFAACLVGVERPARGSAGRRFEAIWTVDPLVVRQAARSAAALVPEAVTRPVTEYLREPVTAGFEPIEAATALMNRSLTYVDGEREGRVKG